MHEQPAQQPERQRPPLRPQIYVASLADVELGRQHGDWLPADVPEDELRGGIQAMLARSPEPGANTWAIHDRHDFAGIRLDEQQDLATVTRVAGGLAKFGPAFAALVNLVGIADATNEAFARRYQGRWSSVRYYAEDLLAACGADRHLEQIPGPLRRYVRIDVDALVRDLESEGDVYFDRDAGGIEVFTAT